MIKNKRVKILAIETSCDETAAAVLVGTRIKSNVVYSQIELHRKTKGVVPEVASRSHIEKIIPVIKEALSNAKVRPLQIDLIAVTVGPGLIGSLLVGVDTAKTLAYIFKKPIIPINHIEAHLYANFASGKIWKIRNPKSEIRNIFPTIVLVVSGGHTSLILMRGHGNYKLLGETLDDAAGESFDKVAKILGLGYPGGPAIAAAAAKSQISNQKYSRRSQRRGRDPASPPVGGASGQIRLPRPMIDSGDFNFSFSGLKTAVLYAVKKLPAESCQRQAAIAAEFQQAVVDVLVSKTIKAALKYKARSIMLGGGVAANKLLRQELKLAAKKQLPAASCLLPAFPLCTDNAAMIGLVAYYKYLSSKKNLKNWRKTRINLNPKL